MFFPAALEHGIVLWEPFGGLCAGLEMALRNGFTIRQYYYGDIDPTAQQVARHRIRKLQTMYPLQLPEQALFSSFSALPMDVKQVTTAQLAAAQEPQASAASSAILICFHSTSAGATHRESEITSLKFLPDVLPAGHGSAVWHLQ